MKTSILILALSCVSSLISQTSSDYSDVAVIVNDNSQISMNIGSYFQQARNVPNQNMIHITTSTLEEIDSLTFELLRQQIEGYLISNNLTDSINYIVTTKGVPLKIYRPVSTGTNFSYIASNSVDSELALMLGSDANSIAANGSIPNSFYSSNQHFSRDSFGIYLVTRLTGYTASDIYNLINRSGPKYWRKPFQFQVCF